MQRILKFKKEFKKEMKEGKERRDRERKGEGRNYREGLCGRGPETLPLTLLCMHVSIGDSHNLPDAFHHVQNKKLKPWDKNLSLSTNR